MELTRQQKEKLSMRLPGWAVKDNPAKKGMSTIHPMAIIQRLNEVFGIGGWHFTTEFIKCEPFVQTTNAGKKRDMWMSAVKGRFEVGYMQHDRIVIEQYGGSSNDDMGDALKGGATDALTKIASYLNIGAEIYKGQGNVDGYSPIDDKAFDELYVKLCACKNRKELEEGWGMLSKSVKNDMRIIELVKELGAKLR